jgi:biopolymer transport protein TolQ
MLQGSLEQAVTRETEENDWGLTFLAVAASVSPFLGLLGTVWGITNSFYAIGSMGSTSINIVAPGIAEALITTIFGLVVAIPCVIFYNLFVRQTRQFESRMIDFSTSLLSTIKADMLVRSCRRR